MLGHMDPEFLAIMDETLPLTVGLVVLAWRVVTEGGIVEAVLSRPSPFMFASVVNAVATQATEMQASAHAMTETAEQATQQAIAVAGSHWLAAAWA